MKPLRLAALLLLAACRTTAPAPEPAAARPVIVIAAGDVSPPSLGAQQLTSELVLKENPDAVLLLGDGQYPDGSANDYAAYYAPTWGRFLDRTYAVPGNHEYRSGSPAGYFGYFGARGGEAPNAYRSFDLGDWHVVALNTNHDCQHVACDEGSDQLKWLEADLAKNTKKCVLAFFHHPRFNSGPHGDFSRAAPIWKVLERHHVELVLNGHEHLYERLGPMDSSGALSDDGLVQFTVGTGGIGFSGLLEVRKASVARSMTSYGVLRLELSRDDWKADFLPVPGMAFTDHAAGKCR